MGSGTATSMSAEEALTVARETQIATPETSDAQDPQGISPGDQVSVAPDLDGGEQAVEGTAHMISRDTIAVLRSDPRAGEICVHFPRAGYRIAPMG